MKILYNGQEVETSVIHFKNSSGGAGVYRTGELGGELVIEATEEEMKDLMIGIDMSIYAR